VARDWGYSGTGSYQSPTSKPGAGDTLDLAVTDFASVTAKHANIPIQRVFMIHTRLMDVSAIKEAALCVLDAGIDAHESLLVGAERSEEDSFVRYRAQSSMLGPAGRFSPSGYQNASPSSS
jgi:hypothetical protein